MRTSFEHKNPALQDARPTPVRNSRPTISREIIEVIRQDIVSGKYGPGERLPPEQTLASMFGVSQPTVREATRALEAMGLVVVRQGSGVFVSSDLQDYVSTALGTLMRFERIGLLATLDIREVLGTYSARLAAVEATDADVTMIADAASACLDAASTASADSATVAKRLIGFQRSLSLAAHNALLSALETYLVTLLIRLQYLAKREEGVDYWRRQIRQFAPDRARIVELLKARDVDGTVAAMSTYLHDQRQMFTSDPQLSRVRIDSPELSDFRSTVDWS